MSLCRPSCVALVLCLASLPACAFQPSESNDPEAVGNDSQEIKGGSLATDYPESVLLLMKTGGVTKELCSGSLVAPNVVITAGHCVHGFDSWSITAPFANGQTSTSTKSMTLDWHSGSDNLDPNAHDVALVILNTPINIAAYPSIATAPVADNSNVINVGRINNGQLSNTALYMSKPVQVTSASGIGFPFDYKGNLIIEPGDSGGPVFVPGTHKLLAVNSGGGNSTMILARVDLLHDWIVEKIAANGGGGSSGAGGAGGSGSSSSSGAGGDGAGGGDSGGDGSGGSGSGSSGSGGPGVPPSYCPGLPSYGLCYGNTLLSCQNGSIHPTSCSALGKHCWPDYAHGHYACM